MLIDGIDETDIRAELARVLASPDFADAKRCAQFLSYIVDETLSGRGKRIKAYNVAVMAFGRGDDFDPQQDSIVRIEAGRMRRALEHYYLTEGRDAAFRITVPKGAYLPIFEHGIDSQPADDTQEKPDGSGDISHRGLRVFVAPFEEEGATEIFSNLGRGFTRQIIMGLTRFSNMFVYGAETTDAHGSTLDLGKLDAELGVDFVLSGAVTVLSDRICIEVLLREAPQGRFVWTETFERDLVPADMFALRDDVSRAVVQSLAQPYGILYSRALDQEGDAPESLGSYQAVLDFYEYWRSFDLSLFEPARIALERAISEDPGFAEAHACLSRLYTNATRFMINVSRATNDPLARGRQLAQEAIRLAPNSSQAHHARALSLWFSGDVAGSLKAYQRARSLNPNDTDIKADLGLRYALLMDWDRGVPELEESYRRNPYQPETYRIGLFLYHFAEGRNEEALRQSRMLSAPDVVHGHLALAASAARLGRLDEALEAMNRVEQISPGYGLRLQADLAARCVHPDMIRLLTDALCEAGLLGAIARSQTT